jgi:hypothetical protein
VRRQHFLSFWCALAVFLALGLASTRCISRAVPRCFDFHSPLLLAITTYPASWLQSRIVVPFNITVHSPGFLGFVVAFPHYYCPSLTHSLSLSLISLKQHSLTTKMTPPKLARFVIVYSFLLLPLFCFAIHLLTVATA